jgi:DNA modification methylase
MPPPETKRFKTLKITPSTPISKSDQEMIRQINVHFKKSDIFLEEKNGIVNIHLRKLNYDQLIEINQKFKSDLLNQIVNKIGQIGSYGIKRRQRIYVDFNRENKVLERKYKEKNRIKYFYARSQNFTQINQNLPIEYLNSIVCGDSSKILKLLPDNCIDVVITSPPYNFGLDYKDHIDGEFWGKYFQKLYGIFDEIIRVLKYGGRIIVNIQPLFSDYIPTHHMISHFFMKKKLIWKGEIIWEKNNYNCKYTAWGSWKSPSNPYLKYTWEFLEIFCKGDLKKAGDKDKIDISVDEFKKWVTAKWSIAPRQNMKKFNHPAVFPEELVERAMKLFSYQDDIILDPFNGVGTTTYVAKNIGRKYMGIEISQDYCQIARRRLESGD